MRSFHSVILGWLAAAVVLVPQLCLAANAAFPKERALRTDLPSNTEQLDALLQARKHAELVQALTKYKTLDEFFELLHWSQDRIAYAGAPLAISLIYGRALFSPMTSPSAALRSDLNRDQKTAARMMLAGFQMLVYNYAVMRVDRHRCADVSAPQARLDAFFKSNAVPIAQLVRSLAAKEAAVVDGTKEMIQTATEWEARTAPLRQNDEYLCSGGLEEMGASLKAAEVDPDSAKEVPNRPGTIGRTIELAPPPNYTPSFLGDTVWRPRSEDERRALTVTLQQWLQIDQPGLQTPAPSSPNAKPAETPRLQAPSQPELQPQR